MASPHPRTAGLILCGGKSSRMGYDKALLRFGAETMLHRIARRMQNVVGPLVLSLAQGQQVPSLPGDVTHVHDPDPYEGPLWGLAEGFRTLQGRAEQVLVLPVDMPFFTEAWMERVVDGLSDHRACLTEADGVANALVAAYDLSLLPKVERLQREKKRRPMFVSEGEPTRILRVEEHWAPEQGPHPLMDMDTPEAYREALTLSGLGNPEGVPVELIVQAPAGLDVTIPPLPLQAATVGEAQEVLLRLYPELIPGDAAARSWGRMRREEDVSSVPLAPSDYLRAGDRLILDLQDQDARATL